MSTACAVLLPYTMSIAISRSQHLAMGYCSLLPPNTMFSLYRYMWSCMLVQFMANVMLIFTHVVDFSITPDICCSESKHPFNSWNSLYSIHTKSVVTIIHAKMLAFIFSVLLPVAVRCWLPFSQSICSCQFIVSTPVRQSSVGFCRFWNSLLLGMWLVSFVFMYWFWNSLLLGYV